MNRHLAAVIVVVVLAPTAGSRSPASPLRPRSTRTARISTRGTRTASGRSGEGSDNRHAGDELQAEHEAVPVAMSYNKGLDRDKDGIACEKEWRRTGGGASRPRWLHRFNSMSKPPDRPLERTRLESADLAVAWEEHAPEFIAWARKPGHDSYWQYHRDQFLELVPPPGRRTLDLGCGEGRLSRDLKAIGHDVAAVDLSPTMLAAAKEADTDLEAHLADAADLPFANESFDLVVAVHVPAGRERHGGRDR